MPDNAMSLNEQLVSLCFRKVTDAGPDPKRTLLTKEGFRDLARRFYEQSAGEPLWVFAYGSLIWKPAVKTAESRRGVAYGWHRSFCLKMTRWRGTPNQPGLMMALVRGGRCNGVVLRLSDGEDRLEQIDQLARRELDAVEDIDMIRLITVETEQGPVRALVFWAGPKGEDVLHGEPLESVAAVLARACGHIGSGAEYLYHTVSHLQEYGIRDRNLWRLQELVAREIKSVYQGEPSLAKA